MLELYISNINKETFLKWSAVSANSSSYRLWSVVALCSESLGNFLKSWRAVTSHWFDLNANWNVTAAPVKVCMLTDVAALIRCTFIQADHHFKNRVGCRSPIISWTKLWSSSSIWPHKTSFYRLKRAESFQSLLFPLTETVCKSSY